MLYNYNTTELNTITQFTMLYNIILTVYRSMCKYIFSLFLALCLPFTKVWLILFFKTFILCYKYY